MPVAALNARPLETSGRASSERSSSGCRAVRSRRTKSVAAAIAPAVTVHGSHDDAPSLTNRVGATRAMTMVAVPSRAPAMSTGSRCRSLATSRWTPRRTQRKASAAMGTFTSRSTCHGAIASTRPPAVGPIASPTRPTVEISVIARTRRPSSSKSRKASAIDPGVVMAAATPIATRTAMSCSAVVTKAVARLAIARRRRPTSMTRRRPTRSESAPKASIRPPKTTAYAPVTHCSATVEACNSRPMVGRATLRIELSSISNRNTADRPTKATHASRRGGGGARHNGGGLNAGHSIILAH